MAEVWMKVTPKFESSATDWLCEVDPGTHMHHACSGVREWALLAPLWGLKGLYGGRAWESGG